MAETRAKICLFFAIAPPTLGIMNITRRRALVPLLALPIVARAAEDPPLRDKEDATPFIGSWFVTSAITSLIVSIEPQGEALFLFIEGGAFSILRTNWKQAPGGILVEGLPRIRLWRGTEPNNVRAEIEPLPEDLEVSVGFRQFPQKFFMRRVANAHVAGDIGKRSLPKEWDKASLEKEWDEKAGQRRP